MSRVAHCPACIAYASGVKTRIALEHTCGLERRSVLPEREVESTLIAKLSWQETSLNGLQKYNIGRMWAAAILKAVGMDHFGPEVSARDAKDILRVIHGIANNICPATKDTLPEIIKAIGGKE